MKGKKTPIATSEKHLSDFIEIQTCVYEVFTMEDTTPATHVGKASPIHHLG
jgi:hypothetical protein